MNQYTCLNPGDGRCGDCEGCLRVERDRLRDGLRRMTSELEKHASYEQDYINKPMAEHLVAEGRSLLSEEEHHDPRPLLERWPLCRRCAALAQTEHTPPTTHDLIGLVPDITGGESAETHVRQLRDTSEHTS